MMCLKRLSALALAIVFGCYAPAMLASATQYDVLQEQEVYTVAYTEDHLPFSYQNEDGSVAGMAIDMMDYIASIAGVTVEYVPLDEVSSDTQEVDIVLSILAADQLESNSIKSNPYIQFRIMLMAEEEVMSYQDAIVGRLDYSAISDAMVEENLVGAVSKSYASYADLQSALSAGEIDYILTTSLVAQETSTLDMVSISTDMTLDAMLKFNNDMSQEKIEAWNAVIHSIDTDDAYAIMLNAALNVQSTDITLRAFLTMHAYQILLVLVCVIAIGIGVVLVLSMNKRRALETLLNVDELTGLMTERKFKIEARKKIVQNKNGESYHIISFDIDNFKYINEIYGYEKGTETIQNFARTLQETFAKADCIARPFADNFLILTKVKPLNGNICGMQECNKCIDRCLNGILGQDYRLITSAGIYEIEDINLSLAYMIDCANIARRRGKGTYKRTEWVFTKELEQEIKVKNDIISSMEKGIREKEFKVYYQPKIDFKTEKFAGAEALVRWFRDDGRQFYPDEFISLFEHNGFIARLDYYVLNEVAVFLAAHPELNKISVNVSGNSFLEQDFVSRVMEIVQRNHILPNRIEIEVTESAIVNEFEIIRHRIDALKELDFTVSMDDFGAGLSSLNRLKDISIDVLKIDKEFLGIDTLSKKGESIISSIIGMAKKIEVETVAEGVETAQQVSLLKNLSCDTAQGFYYAKPLEQEAFLAFVAQRQ